MTDYCARTGIRIKSHKECLVLGVDSCHGHCMSRSLSLYLLYYPRERLTTYYQSCPDDPVVRVFFQGSSQAAKRHWHHVPDGPLNSIVNGHTLPRILHRDWAYLDEVRSTRYRTPEFESYPVHPGTVPIHAIWAAPMTRGTCIILERHKQALARQVPRF